MATMSGLFPVFGRTTTCPIAALSLRLPIGVRRAEKNHGTSSTPRILVILGKRYKTTEAGEGKSGHINAGPNEGIFFLDSEIFLTV